MIAHLGVNRYELLQELRTLGVDLFLGESSGLLANFQVRPNIVDKIRGMQELDPQLEKLKSEVSNGSRTDFWIGSNGTLMLGNRMCVPNQKELKREILEEAHSSKICSAPREYQDVSDSPRALLVVGYEERNSRVCFQMFDMSTS
ncbi:hypothetical protein Pint_11850 [Pistacia integerrima]|uniref:Uncharacterized protein n=1 Tax=Pistacia integerrima TaxID=434235 RepID=A0ACC0XHC8_9ROSI|nr:hypothetical protein Pint_11850 [Pistacia integerrima]